MCVSVRMHMRERDRKRMCIYVQCMGRSMMWVCGQCVCMYSTECVHLCVVWRMCACTWLVWLSLCGCMVHAQEYEAGAFLDCSHITLRQGSFTALDGHHIAEARSSKNSQDALVSALPPQHWGCRHTQPLRLFRWMLRT